MESGGTVTLNLKPLQALRKELKRADRRSVQVGIFKEHNARADGDITNSEVAFKNELGSRAENIPTRSFIRMPIGAKLPEELRNNADFIFKPLMEEGNVEQVLERVGFQAEAVIQDAFDTQGFGTWPPNSTMTAEIKGKNTPLIDTTQLRRAVSSRVAKA